MMVVAPEYFCGCKGYVGVVAQDIWNWCAQDVRGWLHSICVVGCTGYAVVGAQNIWWKLHVIYGNGCSIIKWISKLYQTIRQNMWEGLHYGIGIETESFAGFVLKSEAKYLDRFRFC